MKNKIGFLTIILFTGVFMSCVSIRNHFVVNMLSSWEERDRKILSKQSLPDNITAILDVQYIDSGLRGHLLDIYYPNDLEGPFPVIVNIHGGGFMSGSKEMDKLFGYNIASNGFIVFNINYRLAYFETDIPGQISDVINALDWIGNNLHLYPANNEKVYIISHSAGAYLATMAIIVSKSPRLHDIFNVNQPNINS